MNKVDRKAAYELLDALDGFIGDIRNALQDLCPSDTDSVFDARRDCHIRIQNIEGKLEELKNAVGPVPVSNTGGGGNVMELRIGRKRVTMSRDEQQMLTMREMNEITAFMERFNPDIVTKWGLAQDDSLGDRVKVTILA